MSFGSAPSMPAVPAPTPIPQPNDPSLIDLAREQSQKAQMQEGFEASLLNPGNNSGNIKPVTGKSELGYGNV